MRKSCGLNRRGQIPITTLAARTESGLQVWMNGTENNYIATDMDGNEKLIARRIFFR
jgi:hypothetical protein